MTPPLDEDAALEMLTNAVRLERAGILTPKEADSLCRRIRTESRRTMGLNPLDEDVRR